MTETERTNRNQSDQPLVYSVVVSYREYDETRDCLDSLRELQYDNHEILLINNDDEYDEADRLKAEFSDCQIITTGENLGFSRGFNLGIETALEAGAEYVLVLNNDVVLDPAFLSEAVPEAQSRPNVGLIGGKIYYNDDEPTERIWAAGGRISWTAAKGCGRGCNEIDRGQYDEVEPTGFIAGTQMLIHRDVFESVGLLPEEYFLGGEEWDYCLQARRAGFTILYVPSAVLWHNVGHTDGASYSRYYNLYRNKLIFMRRALPVPLWLCWFVGFNIYCYTVARARYQILGGHNPEVIVPGMRDAVRDHLDSDFGMTKAAFEAALEKDG